MAAKKSAAKASRRKKAARPSAKKAAPKAAVSIKANPKDAAFTKQFRSAVIEKLDDWVKTVPEVHKPLIGAADGSAAMSAKDIVNHVKKRTPLGEKVVSNWAELTLKSIKNTPLA